MISIIMPIYNRAHLIKETVESIMNQSHTMWECIIVDDHSTDNTWDTLLEIVRLDSRFSIYKRPDHIKKGASTCRNYAVSKSKGDYIQFFDSDDIMHPEHLKSKFENIKDKDLVICKLKSFTGTFNKDMFSLKSKSLKDTQDVFQDFVTGSLPIMMVAPLWKKDAIIKHLPFREDMEIFEDHEIYARALFKLKKLQIVDENHIFYRVGESSMTHNFYTDNNKGLHSYFIAKKTVLDLDSDNKIKFAILKMTLGCFRATLPRHDFVSSRKCLDFIEEENLCYNSYLKFKFFRIKLFYQLYRLIGRGETKYNFLFKL